jgi:LmbE family N-acetylglucosaminyl deacetylase
MLNLTLSRPTNSSYKVLCLGAHADDIKIGCGGTVLPLLELYPNSEFYWVVLSSNAERALEAETSATNFLTNAGESKLPQKNFARVFSRTLGPS